MDSERRIIDSLVSLSRYIPKREIQVYLDTIDIDSRQFLGLKLEKDKKPFGYSVIDIVKILPIYSNRSSGGVTHSEVTEVDLGISFPGPSYNIKILEINGIVDFFKPIYSVGCFFYKPEAPTFETKDSDPCLINFHDWSLKHGLRVSNFQQQFTSEFSTEWIPLELFRPHWITNVKMDNVAVGLCIGEVVLNMKLILRTTFDSEGQFFFYNKKDVESKFINF
jgi:hypothetical protein